jgi:hypothetical protein
MARGEALLGNGGDGASPRDTGAVAGLRSSGGGQMA